MEELQKMLKIWSINGKVTQKKTSTTTKTTIKLYQNSRQIFALKFTIRILRSCLPRLCTIILWMSNRCVNEVFSYWKFKSGFHWLLFFFAFNSIKFHHFKPIRLYLLFSVNSLLFLVSKEYWNFYLCGIHNEQWTFIIEKLKFFFIKMIKLKSTHCE